LVVYELEKQSKQERPAESMTHEKSRTKKSSPNSHRSALALGAALDKPRLHFWRKAGLPLQNPAPYYGTSLLVL
jgi:hypothetical protein